MAKIVSETNTENIFRDFYGSTTFIEKSAIPAEYGFKSKKGTEYKGYPDFFIDRGLYAIIVEAKALLHDKAQEEIKYYLLNNKLRNKKDLIGIAISGQNKTSLNVTYYCLFKDKSEIVELVSTKLLKIENIEKLYLRS